MDKSKEERLAVLETQLSILIDILKEIKEEVKNQPSREEFNSYMDLDKQYNNMMEERLSRLESLYSSLAVKIAAISGAIGIATTLIIEFIIK